MKRWRSAAARRLCKLAGRDSIEQAVTEVVRRLTDNVEQVPIDLGAICTKVDIHACRADPDLLVSGELRKNGNGFEIVYAASQPTTRRRFTIAHEIGHAVFERTGAHCPRRGKELERICDMFAAELLAPKALLREHVRTPVDLSEIVRLAKLFDTSATAMALRCHETFGTFVLVAEDRELGWYRGNVGQPIRTLRKQLSAAIEGIDWGGNTDGELDLRTDSGEQWRFQMQSMPTGETRRLFVLSNPHLVSL